MAYTGKRVSAFRGQTMGYQGKFFKFGRFILRNFTRKLRTPPAEAFLQPAVYVCHHQNMRGPIASMAWMPIPVRPWSLNVFLDFKTCYDQFANYTYSVRYGWPKPLACAVAWITSRVVVGLERSAGAIPVYRKSFQSMKTIRQSVEALERGESVILYPDVEYDSSEDFIGEIYDGFLLIERYYHQRTGKHAPFVPLYIAAQDQGLVLGEPIYFEEGDFMEQRPLVRQKIRGAINQMAAEHGQG